MHIVTRLVVLSLSGLVRGEPLLQRRRDAPDVYAREFAREYEPYVFAAIPLHAPVPVLRVLSRAPLQPARGRDARAAQSAPHAAYAGPYDSPRLYAHQSRLYPQVQQYAEPAVQYAEPARSYSQSTRHYASPARPYASEYEAASDDYSREHVRPAYYQKPRRQVEPSPTPPAYEYAAEYGSYAPPLRALPPLTYAVGPYESVAYSASQAAPAVLYARPSPSGGFIYRRATDADAATPAPKKIPLPAPHREKEKDPSFILKIHKYRIVKDDLI